MSETVIEVVGWVSSAILVLTIGKQIYKQYKEGSSEGVSKWLFIGQMAASFGFTAYSWLVGNWVFVATNAIMLLNGLIGLTIVRHHRRHRKGQTESGNIETSPGANGDLKAERA